MRTGCRRKVRILDNRDVGLHQSLNFFVLLESKLQINVVFQGSEPGSRLDFFLSRGGKSGLHMAAGSGVSRSNVGRRRRRGDPTESATENIPPRDSRGKGEKAGQEPTVVGGDIGVQGKPPAEQDQIREKFPIGNPVRDARRPASFDSRVGRLDKWLPLPIRLSGSGKTEFGLSAHSSICSRIGTELVVQKTTSSRKTP